MSCENRMDSKSLTDLLNRSVCEMTKQVANIDLMLSDFVVEDYTGWDSFIIKTTGDYEATLVMSAQEDVFRQITRKMKRDEDAAVKDIAIYVTEYYNITCGFFVSHLNNILHVRARFGIPEFEKGPCGIRFRQNHDAITLRYESSFGRLEIYAEGISGIVNTQTDKEKEYEKGIDCR